MSSPPRGRRFRKWHWVEHYWISKELTLWSNLIYKWGWDGLISTPSTWNYQLWSEGEIGIVPLTREIRHQSQSPKCLSLFQHPGHCGSAFSCRVEIWTAFHHNLASTSDVAGLFCSAFQYYCEVITLTEAIVLPFIIGDQILCCTSVSSSLMWLIIVLPSLYAW